MKFTLTWLKEHLDTSASLNEIVETLTRIGLEVEYVHDPAGQLKDFTIAKVIEAKPHPNADRLRVCMVDTGAGAPVQVVCGAPNARTGMKSVFSAPGTYIPGKKITLGKGVIRGVESLGMLCSSAELELSNDHEGIIDLPDDAPVGAVYAQWAGLDDPIDEKGFVRIVDRKKEGGRVFLCGLYAQGIRQGVPQARQVADRFHLLQNLCESIERHMTRVSRFAGRPQLPPVPGDHQATLHGERGRARQALFD